jgi:hypothetical protein
VGGLEISVRRFLGAKFLIRDVYLTVVVGLFSRLMESSILIYFQQAPYSFAAVLLLLRIKLCQKLGRLVSCILMQLMMLR